MPVVSLTRKGHDRIGSGHPWIYRSDLAREPAGTKPGPVRILDARGHFAALAHYSPKSKIALRLLSLEDQPIDGTFYRERIARSIELRRSMFPDADAVRLVHGEADLLPGLVVDRYGDVLSVQTLTAPMDDIREMLFDLLEDQLHPRAIVERNDPRVRELEGLPQRKGVVRGATPGVIEYHEGTVRLVADPLEGQKTGAFLDQRENHLAARGYARGECLDCFSYSGGFALQLSQVAERVVAVEMAPKAAVDLRASVERNAAGPKVEVREVNVFDLLRDEIDKGTRFDTVVLDPPAFAKTKDKLSAAIRGYKEINLRALQLLRPGGILVTCSCSYHLGPEQFEQVVLAASIDAKRPLQIVERRGASRDHPTLLGGPETRYLKVLIGRVPA
ncbi:MAG: class I SAM-dependent rRNA methyltransferase [Deltaproteobacteria bacterium]